MSDDYPTGDASFAGLVLRGGMPAINAFIDERQEETLHLEFKTLSPASTSTLAKDDRKLLAKAICGLANAEGGTIIVGIGTSKDDGLDVASIKRPVQNLVRLRNRTAAALSELISPQHPQVSVELIPDDIDPSAGYLIIDVPPSDRRPHMSLKEHRYFRRGSDGTRLLEHGEIRDLMLATREGSLDIECNIRSGTSTGDLRFAIFLVLTLRNISRVPVKAPYIRMKNAGWTASGITGLTPRRLADGSFGIYSSRDILVHVDDEIGLAERETGLDFRRTGQEHLPDAISIIRKNDLWESFRMLPWAEMPAIGILSKDKPITVAGFFGAENAAAKTFSFDIDKRTLFEMFYKKMSVG
jgi:Putative DNA-binding domain